MAQQRIIIGISGASGAIYGIRLLEMLQKAPIETHLIISKAARLTITHETDYKIQDIEALADKTYPIADIGACISSGSYHTLGMIIAPCSVKTVAEITSGVTPTLMGRAADVVLKERRKLVLSVRETPLHLGHLRNMAQLTEMGAIIAPPVPAFYNKPESLDDIVNHSCARLLDLFDIKHDALKEWQGIAAC